MSRESKAYRQSVEELAFMFDSTVEKFAYTLNSTSEKPTLIPFENVLLELDLIAFTLKYNRVYARATNTTGNF